MMLKYNVEGNINFYESLYKSLDDDSDNEENLCQITGLPLDSKAITLECNHKFNYGALYTEICKQRFIFKTYDYIKLSHKEQKFLSDSNKDYFIKCPYCRNIQFTILPYYEEIGLDKKYGINSLDPSLPEKIVYTYRYKPKPHILYPQKKAFSCYGVIFEPNKCCSYTDLNDINSICINTFCSTIPNTSLSFCKLHYRYGLGKHKMAEKQKQMDEHKKLLDDKNAERLASGLKPLKRLPKKNTVQSLIQISQYVSDEENNNAVVDNSCKSVLKSGPNKGKQCGCLKIFKDGMCKRHSL
jgi:hypothetical protein